MSRTGAEIRASETQSKFIQDRISQVEKHFGEFCEHIAGFSRKLSKVRDKGDDVSRAIMSYAENESHNHTTKLSLTQFAENFSAVQDYREAEIRRMDDKVISPLTKYGHACKQTKERLKTAFAARKKEITQKEKLEKVRDKKPSDRHTIAETDLQRAGVDAARSSKSLEEEMDTFEKNKLKDIKQILQDFVNIELIFHAKALEMYTICYQDLLNMDEEEDLEKLLHEFINIELIFHAKALEMYTVCYHNLAELDEEEDLEEFRNSLRPTNTSTRLELQRAHSKTSLNSTSGLNGTASHARAAPVAGTATTPAGGRKNQLAETANTTGKSSMYSDDYGTTTGKSSTMYSDSTGQEETMTGTCTGTSTTFSGSTTLQEDDDDDDDDDDEDDEESDDDDDDDDDDDAEEEEEEDEYASRFRPKPAPPAKPPKSPRQKPPTLRK